MAMVISILIRKCRVDIVGKESETCAYCLKEKSSHDINLIFLFQSESLTFCILVYVLIILYVCPEWFSHPSSTVDTVCKNRSDSA